MKIYGFVFARGGSKGLPGKNILPLGGIPLVGHAVRSGLDSGLIDKVFISTDAPEIALAAENYGAEIAFMRPPELAQDNSPEWLAWQHAIKQVGNFDVFVSLPATSPLRTAEDVRCCIETYIENSCDMVVTTRTAQRHPSFNMIRIEQDGLARLVLPLEKKITRRQDAPAVFDMTTVAYVSSPRFILENSGTFDGRVKAVNIPDERALDIDTPLDYAFAEFLYARQQGKEK